MKSIASKTLMATALCLGTMQAAQAADKIINPPSTWGAVRMVVGQKSGTNNIVAFIQRKDTNFCTFVTLGTTSTPSYSRYIVNGSQFNDDMWTQGKDDSTGVLDLSRNGWPMNNDSSRRFTQTLSCSNLGSQTILPITWIYNVEIHGLGGSDLIGLSGYGGRATGGDGNDSIVSYLTSNSFSIDAGNGDDKFIQMGLLGSGSGPRSIVVAGWGRDCMVNNNWHSLDLDCRTFSNGDWMFGDPVNNFLNSCVNRAQETPPPSGETALQNCWTRP